MVMAEVIADPPNFREGPMPEHPTERALQLLSLLQTHTFWPGTELCSRLDVSARTLRRDVDRLRVLGYPVDATPGPAGGYRLAAGAHLPPLLLDDEEAVAIAVGLRAAASESIDGMEETAVRALAKLEQVLPDRLRRRVRAVHANVTPLRWAPDAAVDGDALAVLAFACRDGEQVRFDYQARDGEATRRLVEPHQLVVTDHRWYLVAWDTRRDDWRTFRLDRMTSARLAGVRFRAREIPGGDAAAFVARSIRSMPQPHQAVLDVRGDVDAVRSVLRHDTQLESRARGVVRVRITAQSVDSLLVTTSLLATRFAVRVREPAELRASVALLATRLTT
jgi:predicted DNA-binding transcriptional regulator YafY